MLRVQAAMDRATLKELHMRPTSDHQGKPFFKLSRFQGEDSYIKNKSIQFNHFFFLQLFCPFILEI